MLGHFQRDVKLIMVSRGLRAFAFSYLNVVFAIYLNRLGYSTLIIGVVHSVAYISGALLTAVWGFLSDRYGRRRILVLLAVLTIVSNGIYIFFSHLAFILLAVVIANVGAGGRGRRRTRRRARQSRRTGAAGREVRRRGEKPNLLHQLLCRVHYGLLRRPDERAARVSPRAMGLERDCFL